MNIKAALKIVLELAEDNALTPDLVDGDRKLVRVAEIQDQALSIVAAHIKSLRD